MYSFCDSEQYKIFLGLQVTRELTIAKFSPDLIINDPKIFTKALRSKTELIRKLPIFKLKNNILNFIKEKYNILYLKNNIGCEKYIINIKLDKKCNSEVAEKTIISNIQKFIIKNITVNNIAVFNVMHIESVTGNNVEISLHIIALEDSIYQAHMLNLL